MLNLISQYSEIINQIDFTRFSHTQDKYSGIFLPIPFEEYWLSKPRIMLVGRETAGWNTNNNKNTLERISYFIENKNIHELIDEAINRYKKYLELDNNKKIITKSKSRFKQFYFKLAREMNLDPKSIFYANIFAWDYNKKTPLNRPDNEFQEIKKISIKLLATQINYLKPDFIIFATGFSRIDTIIKELCNQYFDGYKTSAPVIHQKLWEFRAANATCFRIAHPRAMYGHQEYRIEVIRRIKTKIERQVDQKS
ncbi:hypothetical protein [Proteus terrae]|uniref:hypothetical protein n=1 Tax=Proteus terrae TaxID=1574161 RepID=UPI000B4DF543|nr:hypothetical protein [Proteus terrae]PNL48686.1 hypothetical protein CEP63_005465 [Proteus mirabilis]